MTTRKPARTPRFPKPTVPPPAPEFTVRFTDARQQPPGKLADAELHVHAGLLAGCKLIGFAIWQRREGTQRSVTFPARQYSVNGERRSFALLRPINDTVGQDRVRDVILDAYVVWQAEQDAEAEVARQEARVEAGQAAWAEGRR